MKVHGTGYKSRIRVAHSKVSPPRTREEKQGYFENVLMDSGKEVAALVKLAGYVFDIRHLREVRESIRFTEIRWEHEKLERAAWDIDRNKEWSLTIEKIFFEFDADIPKDSRKISTKHT